MKKALNKLILTLLLLAFAILSTGSLRLYTLTLGLIVSAVIAIVFEKTLFKRSLVLRDVKKIVYLLEFLLYFITSEIKAHTEMTKIILFEKNVKPAIIAIPYNTQSDYGITLVALSITNTPGTIVLHLDKNTQTMYVHWINAVTLNPREAWERISKKFNELAKNMFG